MNLFDEQKKRYDLWRNVPLKNRFLSTIGSLKQYEYINWALIDQALVSGVNFATGILLARFLGMEEFGTFTLSWAIVLFINGLQLAIVTSPMMSIGPKRPVDQEEKYYGAVFSKELIFSFFFFLLFLFAWLLAHYLMPAWKMGDILLPLAFATLGFQLQDFIRRYNFTRLSVYQALIIDAISYLGRLSLLVWGFFFIRMDSACVLWMIAVSSGIAFIIGVPGLPRLILNWKRMQELLKRDRQFVRWLTPAAVVQWLSGNVFLFAAGAWLEVAAAGTLKAAQNVMGVTHILFQGFENIVPVQAAQRLSSGGERALIRYLIIVTVVGICGTTAISLGIALFPEFWVDLLYEGSNQEIAKLMVWYALIYPIVFLSLMLRIWLRTLENTRSIFISYVIMTSLAIVSVYPLIRYLGIFGVPAGVLLTNIVMVISLWVGIRKNQNVSLASTTE